MQDAWAVPNSAKTGQNRRHTARRSSIVAGVNGIGYLFCVRLGHAGQVNQGLERRFMPALMQFCCARMGEENGAGF